MKTTAEMIAVMQAFEDGKPIEFSSGPMTGWAPVSRPSWGWDHSDYRVAVTKPSVDWSHVATEYRWMAEDKFGNAVVCTEEPFLTENMWSIRGVIQSAKVFASFTPGTCDWKDSLVLRPEGV